jgi:hypothetical protein
MKKKEINLSEKSKDIQLGRYKHYKGGEYELLGIVINSESLEEMVLYMAGYGQRLMWVRPLKMFFEEVDLKGKKVKRFKFLGK